MTQPLQNLLAAYQPDDEAERAHRDAIQELIAAHGPACFYRDFSRPAM